MARMCLIAAALIFIAVPWAGAGNFEVLGSSGLVQAPQPVYKKPGAVVKAEFRSSLTTRSDAELEPDRVVPEKVAAKNDAGQILKPAITYRDRPTRPMAPPPKANDAPHATVAAESQDLNSDLESDLEKDLVLSPPPAKTEQPIEAETTTTKGKTTSEKPSVAAVKKQVTKQKSNGNVKQMPQSAQEKFAISSKPIHKVRPVTSNSWFGAAGSYDRQGPTPVTMNSDPRMLENYTPRPVPRPYPPTAVRGVPPMAGPDRIVRDGVTIKLAPATAGPMVAQPPQEDDGFGSDLFSTAAEIIGLPFAFISSFF